MNQQQPVSKESRRTARKMAAWAIPASVLAVLGAFFSFYFLPLGIILFVVTLLIVAANVLWSSAEEALDTSD